MTRFRYQGYGRSGGSVTGAIEAASDQAALLQLGREGVIPVLLQPEVQAAAGDARASGRVAAGQARSGRVPLAARTRFVRELATFIEADVPLLESLHVLGSQEEHPALRIVIQDLAGRVQAGEAFSHALAARPRVFPVLLHSMVRVGETGGLLGAVLTQMADWMEHEEQVRGEIRSALAYPLVVLSLGIVTVLVLVSFVLPKITTIFAGMEANLPLPTRILMGTADFMGRWWWMVVGGAMLAAALLLHLVRIPAGRRLFDRHALRAPLFGPLLLKAALARVARASAALLEAGVPLLEALRAVRHLAGNTMIVALLDGAIERVTRGESLSRTLAESAWLPPSVSHLLGVGERTGRLAGMMARIADGFERETRLRIKLMLDLLSPLLIIALAVIVGLIALAILLPIFQMNRLMK